MSFCNYLREIKANCGSCYEDRIGACHISLGSQEYYKGFGLSDIIMIIRHNSQLRRLRQVRLEIIESQWDISPGSL